MGRTRSPPTEVPVESPSNGWKPDMGSEVQRGVGGGDGPMEMFRFKAPSSDSKPKRNNNTNPSMFYMFLHLCTFIAFVCSVLDFCAFSTN